MTGPRDRHLAYEELISASLAGDLTTEERVRLDAHLDTCAACRATLAAFSDQRRIMAGIRHVAPPRDLGARVRTGIEGGRFAPLPWWRRPVTLVAGVGGGLAAVAGALLAIVLLNQPSPSIGDASPTPSPGSTAVGSPSPASTFPVGPTPAPTASPVPASPGEPAPTQTPASPSPEPDAYLALTGPYDNLALTLRHGPTGETIAEADTPSGPPIAAELSPDGEWIAYVTRLGESGMHEVRVTRIAEVRESGDDQLEPIDTPVQVGETVVLGDSLAGGPFLERLAWSGPRGRTLAYTLADPETGETDVWIFERSIGEPYRLTDTGNAYAGSWIPGDGEASLLWISLAGTDGAQPVSHVVAIDQDDAAPAPIDPDEVALDTAEGVFQPMLSPNGRLAIYWNGAMDRVGDGWGFVAGAQPYLADHRFESERFGFDSARPMFTDLSVGRDGFESAAITWGLDGIAYAVWNARWTGTPQSGDFEDPYPDERRVYFGHATDPRGLTRQHAIDLADIPEGSSVVDVKVSPTGEHLVITALRPVGGALEAPTADLLLVERNTGNEADEVLVIRSAEDGWFGPAAFDGAWETAIRP